jgi:hypothetical protein
VTSAQPSQAQPGPYEGRARGGRSAKDMALSMAVLLIPVFLFLIGYRVFFAGDAPIPVDAGQTYATAQHDAHFPVLVPQNLPSGWTPIAAKFDPPVGAAVLRVSYVTPAKSGLQLIESAGRQWREYPVAKGGGRALVLAADGYTTVITGTATDNDMRTIAAALH